MTTRLTSPYGRDSLCTPRSSLRVPPNLATTNVQKPAFARSWHERKTPRSEHTKPVTMAQRTGNCLPRTLKGNHCRPGSSLPSAAATGLTRAGRSKPLMACLIAAFVLPSLRQGEGMLGHAGACLNTAHDVHSGGMSSNKRQLKRMFRRKRRKEEVSSPWTDILKTLWKPMGLLLLSFKSELLL